MYNGSEELGHAMEELNIQLAPLVAATAIWANPAVHERIMQQTGSYALYPNRRRAQSDEARRQKVGDIVLDDNTYANTAIKRATGLFRSKPEGYHACHIWDRTCYDEKCHTVVANLVLVPAALSALTDFDPATMAALRRRSWELYGWLPPGKDIPDVPENYPQVWREPEADQPNVP